MVLRLIPSGVFLLPPPAGCGMWVWAGWGVGVYIRVHGGKQAGQQVRNPSVELFVSLFNLK